MSAQENCYPNHHLEVRRNPATGEVANLVIEDTTDTRQDKLLQRYSERVSPEEAKKYFAEQQAQDGASGKWGDYEIK